VPRKRDDLGKQPDKVGVMMHRAGAFSILTSVPYFFATLAVASPVGDACRMEICRSAVSACKQADLALNPFARTEAEKQAYCTAFFNGCMSREVTADLPWYSPEMVARFLQCPP
jgi:hypothetical protein